MSPCLTILFSFFPCELSIQGGVNESCLFSHHVDFVTLEYRATTDCDEVGIHAENVLTNRQWSQGSHFDWECWSVYWDRYWIRSLCSPVEKLSCVHTRILNVEDLHSSYNNSEESFETSVENIVECNQQVSYRRVSDVYEKDGYAVLIASWELRNEMSLLKHARRSSRKKSIWHDPIKII